MATGNPADTRDLPPPGYSPTGLARRAAQALRFWRSDAPARAPQPAVVSFAQLTERLRRYLSSAVIARVKEAF